MISKSAFELKRAAADSSRKSWLRNDNAFCYRQSVALLKQENGELRRDSSTGVEDHVAIRSGAARKVTLMPFIESSHNGCSQ